MKYVVLLRGINVGGNRKVPMAQLKLAFMSMHFTEVTTYINSGNVIGSAPFVPDARAIEDELERVFGFVIDVLVLTADELVSVARAIPNEWQNDTAQKSDVVFLFDDADSPAITQTIGYRPEFEAMQYVPHALITNISRQNQPKSSLLKLMGTPLYKRMTIRNVTTVRKLAGLVA